MKVQRLVIWSTPDAVGTPEVLGAPLPREDPAAQSPPAGGKDPRVPPRRYHRRLERSRHTLVGYVAADGFPMLRPVDLTPDGVHLRVVGTGLPNGARRAGVLTHWFEPRMKGQGQAVLTGWLETEDGRGAYAPHTCTGYTMPRVNDVGFTLAAGLRTKVSYRKAVRLGRVRDGEYRRTLPAPT